ncbi:pseudouridine synthase family protein, partial [Tanacetum coccineum]
DAGVHALSNVCHEDLPPHEPSVVKKAVNHFLQRNEGDIMITDVRCVAADFHARYKAQERTYFYRLLSGPESLSIIEIDRAWQRNLIFQQCRKLARFLRDVMISSSLKASGCQVLISS